MISKSQARVKLIGEVLPYVFIDSVHIEEAATLRSEDTKITKGNDPTFNRNEFGNNKLALQNQQALMDRDARLVTVTVSMNDFFKNSVWYRVAPQIGLQVKVFAVTDENTFNFLLNSSYSDASSIPKEYRENVEQRILSFNQVQSLSKYKVREIEGFEDQLCTVSTQHKFIIKSDFFALIAFPQIGNSQESSGHRTTQKVLQNNTVVEDSIAFYSPDGTLWKGPVHRHPEKGIMEGRVHTPDDHNVLTVVQHKNKIKDYSVFRELREIQGSIKLSDTDARKGTYYSDLFISGDKQGIVRGMFVFDIIKYLQDNSEFNTLVTRQNLSKLRSLMSIENMSVFRTNQDNTLAENSIVQNTRSSKRVVVSSETVKNRSSISPSINRENEDGKQEKVIGSLREVRLSGLNGKRAFSFVDREINEATNGTYVYGVDLRIKDPTIEFVDIQIFNLKEARRHLLSYYEEANQKSNFSPTTSKLSNEYLSYLQKINNLNIQTKGLNQSKSRLPWRTSVHLYVRTLEILTGKRLTKRQKRKLQKLIVPSSRSLKGAEMFLSLINDLLKTLQATKGAIKENKSRSAGGRRNSSKGGLLEEEKHFSNTSWSPSRFNNRSYHLSYLQGIVSRGDFSLPSVNRQSLINRFDVEASKFFPELVGKREEDVREPEFRAFRKIYYSALTPSIVETKGEEIVLSKSVKDSYSRILKILRRRNLFSNFFKNQSSFEEISQLGVKIRKRKNKKDRRRKIGSSEYFAREENFANKEVEKPSDIIEERVEKDPVVANEEEKVIESVALFKKPRFDEYLEHIAAKDTLPRRYLKMLLQKEGGSSIEEKVEAEVLSDTLATVRYVVGFDSNMKPVYSDKLPVTADPFIYLIHKEADSQENVEEVYDSVGLVFTGGTAVPVETISKDDPCEDPAKPPDPTIADPKPIPAESPCGEGYTYINNECVPDKPVEVVLEPEDPPILDVEPELGQTVVSVLPPEPREPVSTQETEFVRGTSVSQTSQQESYFVRTREQSESREGPIVDNALSITRTTSRSGGTSGY